MSRQCGSIAKLTSVLPHLKDTLARAQNASATIPSSYLLARTPLIFPGRFQACRYHAQPSAPLDIRGPSPPSPSPQGENPPSICCSPRAQFIVLALHLGRTAGLFALLAGTAVRLPALDIPPAPHGDRESFVGPTLLPSSSPDVQPPGMRRGRPSRRGD